MLIDQLIVRRSDTGKPTDYALALGLFLLSKEGEGCSPKTITYYRQQLTWFRDFVAGIDPSADLKTIRRNHVDLYLVSMRNRNSRRNKPISPFSVRSAFTAIRAFFNYCVTEEHLPISPIVKLTSGGMLVKMKAPKTPKVCKPFLPDGAQAKMLALCHPGMFLGARDGAIVRLFDTTGMRAEENSRLKIEDLDWRKSRIKIWGKGARERWVPFSQGAKSAVLRYLSYRRDDLPCLWVTEERTPLTLSGLEEIMKRLRNRSGLLEVHDVCHVFRRTWAMRQLRAGIPIKQVQIVGGWESLAVLEGYVRAMSSEDAMSVKWV